MSQSISSVNGRVGNVLDWVRWISQVLVIPLLGLVLVGWWRHEEKIDTINIVLAHIKGTRFTTEDGVEAWQEMARIKSEMLLISERLAVHIANTLPASQLMLRSEADARYIDHERRIGAMEARGK